MSRTNPEPPWIRFGRVARNHIVDDNRRVVSFAPNSVFALVYWAANDYGTIRSEIHILRTVAPGEPFAPAPDVQPGADILLQVSGWPKVEKVLHAIDAVEALGIDRPRPPPTIGGTSIIGCQSTAAVSRTAG